MSSGGNIATISIDGMTCSSCTGAITRHLTQVDGVFDCNIALSTASAQVTYDAQVVSATELCDHIEDIGFGAELMKDETPKDESSGGGSDTDQKSLVFVLQGSPPLADIPALETSLKSLKGMENVSFTGLTAVINPKDFVGADLGDLGAIEMIDVEAPAQHKLSPEKSQGFPQRSDDLLQCLMHYNRVAFSWLTGVDLLTGSEDATCRVHCTINETTAEGTGARSIMHHIHTNLPPHSGLKATVEPQGSFLLAKMMRAKYEKEMVSLGRTTVIATIFTLPLFFMSMLLMDHTLAQKASGTIGRELVPGMSVGDLVLWVLCTPVQFGSGWRFHKKALSSLKTREVGMDFLVSTGTSAAYFYSVATIIRGLAQGQSLGMEAMYFETSAVLITVILLGKYLEVYTRGVTASAINMLMNIRGKTARLAEWAPGSHWERTSVGAEAAAEPNDTGTTTKATEDKEEDQILDVTLLQKGDVCRLVTGEMAPADCRVINGHVGIDESMLTGESVMVGKKPGSLVFGGTMVLEGSATAAVELYGDDTMLGRIVSTVQQTQADKPAIQEYADRVAAYFVPVVTLISLSSLLVWSIASATDSVPESWYTDKFESPYLFSFLFALAVWVSACPCAFGLASPTAVLVATGVAAKHGVLIRRGSALQRAASIDAVAFDKTGTLTLGQMVVTDFMSFEYEGLVTEAYLLELLYEAERRSSHPLAKAIATFCQSKMQKNDSKDISTALAYEIEVVAGRGLRLHANEAAAEAFANAESKSETPPEEPLLLVGSSTFLASHGVGTSKVEKDATSFRRNGKVAIFAAVKGKLAALLGISDEIHAEARAVLDCLRVQGAACYMVTGDEPATAYAIGAAVGIPRSHILASALPSDKEAFIQGLQEKHGRKVAFVGDGTNDANALARAEVGIALGGGTDVAIDTGDMVLVQNDLSALLVGLDISTICYRRIKINYFWALIYNVILLPIAAGALYPSYQFALDPMLAGAAMAASSVSIVVSSLLLRMYGMPSKFQEAHELHMQSKSKPTTQSSIDDEEKGGANARDASIKLCLDIQHNEEKEESVALVEQNVEQSVTPSSGGGWFGMLSTTKTGKANGPCVGEVMDEGDADVSNSSNSRTAHSRKCVYIPASAVLSDGGTVEYKSCGCVRAHCKCGLECRCGEKRLMKIKKR